MVRPKHTSCIPKGKKKKGRLIQIPVFRQVIGKDTAIKVAEDASITER